MLFWDKDRRSILNRAFPQNIIDTLSQVQRLSKRMSKEEAIKVEGVITKALPNATFMVTLDNGHEVLGHISGKMRKHYIRINPGDRVSVELSPYDLTRGRITYRSK